MEVQVQNGLTGVRSAIGYDAVAPFNGRFPAGPRVLSFVRRNAARLGAVDRL